MKYMEYLVKWNWLTGVEIKSLPLIFKDIGITDYNFILHINKVNRDIVKSFEIPLNVASRLLAEKGF